MTTRITKETVEQELAQKGYHILEKIGEGGSRVAFLARRDLVVDPVVIRIFKHLDVHERIDDKRRRVTLEDMLKGELEVIRRFSHESLVRYFNHGPVNGSYFIEEEFMEGGSLASHLGELSEEKIVHLFERIAAGMDYLHSKGFYVRDFKLENVLTDRDLTVAKISDLELSGKIVPNMPSRTLGSERYSAPELEQGRESDPRKTDILALGCGLYYMLTGQAHEMKGMNKLSEAAYNRKLKQILSNVPRRFRETVDACLAFNPTDRPLSADEVRRSVHDQNPLPTALFNGRANILTPTTYLHETGKTTYRVRDLEGSDVETVAEILMSAFSTHNIFGKPKDEVTRYVTNTNITYSEKGGGYVVCEVDGQTEGCMLVRTIDLDTKKNHMRVVYNHLVSCDGFTDRPVISRLIEAADRKMREHMRSNGVSSVKVGISLAPEELGIIPTLRKMGFRYEGTIRDNYRLGEDTKNYGKLMTA